MRIRRQEGRLRLGVLVAVAAAFGVLVSTPLGSGADGSSTATSAPVADLYVRADRPTQNFGKASRLVIAGRPVSVAYLRFRAAVPPGRTVTRAKLRLFASAKAAAAITVHRVGSARWGESTTTYANAPAVGPGAAVPGAVRRGGGYITVDVTSLVGRGGLVSLAVRGSSTAPVSLRSRESASGQPRLLVVTSSKGVGAVSLAPPATQAPAPAPSPSPSPAVTTTTPSGASGGTGGGGGGGGSGGGGSGGGVSLGKPCGTVSAPPVRIDHVIWIWMENKPYNAIIGSPSAPFENELAGACGLATNYQAITHPSLPNYIAATSGGTQGVVDNDPPASHPLDVPSIFSQVEAQGKTWRSYQENAPSNCALVSSGLYAVKHDPAAYYTGIRGDCASWDVPMGTTAGGNFLSELTNGTLPAFSFVTPDLCNGTHDCPVQTGDAWLAAWIAKIVASPTYLAGRTVVFLTWDEDDGTAADHIPMIVVNPSTPAGTRSSASFNHYSLLKTTEQLLGVTTFLGHAGDAGTSSMLSAFNLGSG
jgi:phosphatidylinositol-3-phosphatase